MNIAKYLDPDTMITVSSTNKQNVKKLLQNLEKENKLEETTSFEREHGDPLEVVDVLTNILFEAL